MEAKLQSERQLLDCAQRHLLGNYRPAKMILSRGRGCELFDTEGRRYLDFCAGVAVCCLGHGHPALVKVIQEQAAELMHVSNYFYSLQNVKFVEELCAATGFDRAFCCNSGAEANEALLKLVRQHFYQQGKKDRWRIIAFERSFHGRTMGALALTGNPTYQEGFGPALQGVQHVPFGDLDAVAALMGPEVAAIHVEPVQGEGGVLPPPEGFHQSLRSLCDEHGALLVFDEVQVGMGRTGKLLGADHFGVKADAIALAKGLGGGFPMGVMLLREHLAGALPPGKHGSTFGGSPLSSAVGRTVLRVLHEEKLIERAAEQGERLSAGLAKVAAAHPKLCTGERGLGLLRAITLTDQILARDVLGPARDNGLLVTAAGPRAVRFTPPLVVSEAEIAEAVERIDATLTKLESEAG